MFKDKNLIESGYLDTSYSEEIYKKMAGNKEFTEKYQQKELDKQKKKLEEKYPAPEYSIVIYRSEHGGIKYSVYKSENASSKIAAKVLNGDLEAFNDIENPITFLEEINKTSGGESAYSILLSKLQEGKINKNEFLSYLKTLDSIIFDFEDDYKDKIQMDLHDSQHNHLLSKNDESDIVQNVKNLYKRTETLQEEYKSGELDRTEILKLRNYIKEKYGFDLTEIAIAGIIDLKRYEYENKNYDDIIASFEEKDFFAGENFSDFVNKILIYNGYNDTLESIGERAKIIEKEYNRYNFNINNSSVADIQKKINLNTQKSRKKY